MRMIDLIMSDLGPWDGRNGPVAARRADSCFFLSASARSFGTSGSWMYSMGLYLAAGLVLLGLNGVVSLPSDAPAAPPGPGAQGTYSHSPAMPLPLLIVVFGTPGPPAKWRPVQVVSTRETVTFDSNHLCCLCRKRDMKA